MPDLEQWTSPEPSNISLPLFKHLLSLYPTVIKAVYSAQIKDPKKLATALDDDRWRYETLPGRLVQENDAALSMEDLQRLVQWKITHGKYRPFLPGLIRKNAPESVHVITREAFTEQALEKYLTSGPSDSKRPTLPTHLAAAIVGVSKLQGVGPATAPLLCSIYDPVNVPFFEDELFMWFFPDHPKLKYDTKEYTLLFWKVKELRERLAGNEGASSDMANFKAVDVERVAFVTGHHNVLDGVQVASLPREVTSHDVETGYAERPGQKLKGKQMADQSERNGGLKEVEDEQEKKPTMKQRGRKRAVEEEAVKVEAEAPRHKPKRGRP